MEEIYHVYDSHEERRLWLRIRKDDERVKIKLYQWIEAIKKEKIPNEIQVVTLCKHEVHQELLVREVIHNNHRSIYCRCDDSQIVLHKTKLI